MEKTILLSALNVEQIQVFCGQQHCNIKYLEQHLGCTIVQKGNSLIVQADKNNIKSLETIINKMINDILAFNSINLDDIHNLAIESRHDKDLSASKIYIKSKPIKPLTSNQAELFHN